MVSLIVAVAQNGVIGGDNRLLWHISEDLKNFKRITTGHPVVMGRKTYESLGRPLPNRKNVVITRQDIAIEGCQVVHSLEEALALFSAEQEVFIIGGAQIYKQALPIADKLYITHVHHDYKGDTLFPEYDAEQWTKLSAEHFERGEKYEFPFTFEEYHTRRWSIRPATAEDIPLISQMADQTFVNTYKGFVPMEQLDYMMDMWYSYRALSEQFAHGEIYYILYDENSCAVGYGSIEPQGKARYHLQKLYVLPSAQGKGYGAILFGHLLREVKRLCGGGECCVELNVNRENPAVGFYFGQGMQIAQQGDYVIEGTDFVKNDYILRKEL